MKMKLLLSLLVIAMALPVFAQTPQPLIPDSYIKDSGKPVLIMFTAAWCSPCQYVKIKTFKDQSVAPLLKRVNLILFDIDTAEGKDLQEKLCPKSGVPYFILMDKDQNIIDRRSGASTDASEFANFLNKAF